MTLFSSVTSKSGKIKMKGGKKKLQAYLHSCFIGHAERKSLVSLEGEAEGEKQSLV